MKVQKKFDFIAVILLISFFLVPCLFVHSADAEELKVLRWGSSSVGASNYNWCAGVSNLINKYTDYEASVVPSGGSMATVMAISRKQREFGIAAGDVVYSAFTGTREFEKMGKQPVKMIAKMYSSSIQIVADKSIKTAYDFKGKTFMYKRKPIPSWNIFGDELLKAYGLSCEDVKCKSSIETKEVEDALVTGSVDIGLIGGGFPLGRVMRLLQTQKLHLVSFDKEKLAPIAKKYSFFSEVTIPAGTYKYQEQDVTTMKYPTYMVCRADLPEKLVYEVTKAIFDHFGEFAQGFKSARAFKMEEAVRDPRVDVHPGAVKYFKEKGVWGK